MSSENPTPASDLDLIHEQVILRKSLDTTDSDDNDDDVSSASLYSIICTNCKHPPGIGEDLLHCSGCQTCYCSIQCQKKDLSISIDTSTPSLLSIVRRTA